MNTSQEHHSHNDEIDLIELFAKLWKKKLTILLATAVFGCLGIGYLLLTPGKYVGEFVLRGPIGTRLATYAPLNDGIKEHYGEFLQASGRNSAATNQFEISTDGIVADMVRELQDFEEFSVALKKHDPIIRKMSDDEFLDARAGLFSRISINLATDRDPEVRVSLEWSDEDQLLDILVTTLASAEKNLNADKLELLKGLANNIERRALNEMKSLERELTSVRETVDLEVESRLLFLKEQASIARALDLAENNLSESGQGSEFSFNISTASEDTRDSKSSPKPLPKALYLRGYKSLEREIEIVDSRTNEQKYILNPSFLNVKRHAIELKNDASAELFRDSINTSPFASSADIFNISRIAIRVENARNASLILGLSLVLGLFASCIFLLMRDGLRRHQNEEKV